MIISDSYTSSESIPEHLITREYFQELASALKPSGMVIFNFIINPTLSDLYSKNLVTTMRSVFSGCTAMPSDYKDQVMNVLYFCRNSNPAVRASVYTDNMNNASEAYFLMRARRDSNPRPSGSKPDTLSS